MTTTDRTDLTKVSAWLIPKTMLALDIAVEQTGDNKNDTLNRAVQIYAYLTDLRRQGYAIRARRVRGWWPFRWSTTFDVKWIDRDGAAR